MNWGDEWYEGPRRAQKEIDALRAELAAQRLRADNAFRDVEDMRRQRDRAWGDVAVIAEERDAARATYVNYRDDAEECIAAAEQDAARACSALVDALGSYFRCPVCHATSDEKGCREFDGVWREYCPTYEHEEGCTIALALAAHEERVKGGAP